MESLARLRGNPDFAGFIEVSLEYEREFMGQLVAATDDAVIHRAQGAVKALQGLRELYDTAPAILRRISGK